jgi:hypothetical protein
MRLPLFSVVGRLGLLVLFRDVQCHHAFRRSGDHHAATQQSKNTACVGIQMSDEKQLRLLNVLSINFLMFSGIAIFIWQAPPSAALRRHPVFEFPYAQSRKISG